MDERHRIFLIGGTDDEVAEFTLIEQEDDCELRCEYRGKAISRTASDFFQALSDVRHDLAREGLIPFCYGASLNVYPSGMARQMGAGLKAYRLTMGQQARMADLVEIFSTGPDVIPAHVEAQEAFFQDWIGSLRG